MDWADFLHQAVHHLMPAVPWLIGGACVAMVSLGPVGRALSQRLRGGSTRVGRSTALSNEVNDMRADIEYVLERLDEQQRILTSGESRRSAPRVREWSHYEDRVETPV